MTIRSLVLTAVSNCSGASARWCRRIQIFLRVTIRRGREDFSTTCWRHPVMMTIAATTILSELLRWLGPIWPSRIQLAGVALGDCWRHPSIEADDATNGLVPLHKLSQWLSYSLIEPLQRAGLSVTDLDGLTGLAEYRNGGLFIDAGVLNLRDPADQERDHEVGSPLGGGVAGADRRTSRPSRGFVARAPGP